MKLLLDTHALIWWCTDDPALGQGARAAIANPDTTILISIVSLWEAAVKIRLGKLRLDLAALDDAIGTYGFTRLAIQPAHLSRLLSLPQHHRDPFDHLLIAQAIAENATFVTEDQRASAYPVQYLRCSLGAAG